MIRFILIFTITFAIGNSEDSVGLFSGFYRNNFPQFFHKTKSDNENSLNFDNRHSVCRSKQCFRVAAELWESVNKSVDPCEDFYEYACGKWTINNPIPSNKAEWNSRSKTEMKIENRIRDLLQEKIQPDDILTVKQLKKFYRSCMNIGAIENMGIKRLQAILTNNGGWPMAMEFSEWDPQEFSWQQIDKNYLKLSSSSPFYDLRVTHDTRDFDFLDYLLELGPKKDVKMILELSIPQLPSILPMKSQDKINRSILYESGQYAKLITKVALTFAKERDTIVDQAQLATDVEDIINLEKTIEKETDDMEYETKVVSLEELQNLYDNITNSKFSKINWISTITDYFALANVEINKSEEIEFQVNYLQVMVNILEKTKPRTVVNYLHWYFLKQFLTYTTQHMRMLEFNLYKEMTGVIDETPRSEECVKEVEMDHAKAYLFVKKYFTDDMREHAEEMFHDVQKAMVKHILRADWLDDEMRKSVLQKINNMQTRIGYPNWYNNASAVENYYRGMTIGNQFLENIFSSKKFKQRKILRSIRNTVEDDEWSDFDTLEVNAFYNPFINSLSIPAGEFQTSFYSPSFPEIMSYGSIGFTVGHEVSHGFEVDGIKTDGNGKKIRYSYDMRSEYKRRANCFLSQYDDYYKDKTKEKKADESFLTRVWNFVTLQTEWTEEAKRKQGENMADSLGLEIVFDALQEIENEKNSPRFPGFEDFSNDQFFFLTYANVWCYNSRSKFDDFMLKYDSHSEDRYRVIAAVQNSQEFAKAFKCPQGSAMNPERKCKIW